MSVDDFLDEERDPVGAGQHVGNKFGRWYRVEQMRDQVADGALPERLEFDHRHGIVPAQGPDELISHGRLARPERGDDGEAVNPRRCHVPNGFEAVRVRRVQVVKHEQGATARDLPQHPHRAFDREQPQLPAGKVGPLAPRRLPLGEDQPQPAIERRAHRGHGMSAQPRRSVNPSRPSVLAADRARSSSMTLP